MKRHLVGTVTVFLLVLGCVFNFSGTGQAAIITFSGVDNGIGPGVAPTNSNAAEAAFLASLGAASLIDFESVVTPGNFVNLDLGGGVTVSLSGNDPSFSGIKDSDQHSPSPLGFNTTTAGSQWLQVSPFFSSAIGATVTFSFDTPIDAFGAYLTDTQVGFPGPITLFFNDGSMQNLNITKNDDQGGVLFFGFTDFGAAISAVSYNTGATDGTRDIWGIDDVRYRHAAVPEPSTMLLLGIGLFALGATGRKLK